MKIFQVVAIYRQETNIVIGNFQTIQAATRCMNRFIASKIESGDFLDYDFSIKTCGPESRYMSQREITAARLVRLSRERLVSC